MLKRWIGIALVAMLAAMGAAQDEPQGMELWQMTMKPAALTPEYKAVVIKQAGAGGGLMDMFMNPMMMLMGALGSMGQDKAEQPPFEQLSALELSWTKGETQAVFGQTFLVTYKIDMDFSKIMKMDENKDFSTLDLRLQLVRPDSIQTLIPRPDITPEVYIKMLKPVPKPPAEPAKPAKPAK